jgi:hypothetical protein
MTQMVNFGRILLILNIRHIPPMCFVAMTGVPLPFGKDLCGLLRLLKWGIGGMWVMGRV